MQHYQLNQENVQYLALRLSSKARSIYNELRLTSSLSINGGGSAGEEEEGDDEEEGADRRNAKKRQERVSTAIIAGVADVLSSVKGLVSWLNRYLVFFFHIYIQYNLDKLNHRGTALKFKFSLD